MQFFKKIYILPILLLVGSIFLFAPINKARAVETGAPCSTDAQCPTAPQQRCLTAQHTLGPGNCGIACRNVAHCPSGWKCTDIIGEFGLCSEQAAESTKVCNSDSNCLPPERCLTAQHLLGPGSCGIACRYDAQCPNAWKCANIIGEFGLCEKPPLTSGESSGTSVKDLQNQAKLELNKANFSGPADLINRAIRILMAFIGSIALVLYIYSGFLWMTASGNAEQAGKAKTTMVWTTLGVLMMLASYMLASFLFKSLGV